MFYIFLLLYSLSSCDSQSFIISLSHPTREHLVNHLLQQHYTRLNFFLYLTIPPSVHLITMGCCQSTERKRQGEKDNVSSAPRLRSINPKNPLSSQSSAQKSGQGVHKVRQSYRTTPTVHAGPSNSMMQPRELCRSNRSNLLPFADSDMSMYSFMHRHRCRDIEGLCLWEQSRLWDAILGED